MKGNQHDTMRKQGRSEEAAPVVTPASVVVFRGSLGRDITALVAVSMGCRLARLHGRALTSRRRKLLPTVRKVEDNEAAAFSDHRP